MGDEEHDEQHGVGLGLPHLAATASGAAPGKTVPGIFSSQQQRNIPTDRFVLLSYFSGFRILFYRAGWFP